MGVGRVGVAQPGKIESFWLRVFLLVKKALICDLRLAVQEEWACGTSLGLVSSGRKRQKALQHCPVLIKQRPQGFYSDLGFLCGLNPKFRIPDIGSTPRPFRRGLSPRVVTPDDLMAPSHPQSSHHLASQDDQPILWMVAKSLDITKWVETMICWYLQAFLGGAVFVQSQ